MALKDKLLQAAAVGAAFVATFAGPRMNADQQQDTPAPADAAVAYANKGNAFALQGKKTHDSLKFSLMGVEIDTAEFAKEQQKNPNLKDIGMIQTDQELGISIKDSETGQTYQIFADRNQVMDFSKNPDKDPSTMNVTMSVVEKDGTCRAMVREDAERVAECFIDALYKLDSADLVDANGILAKAAECSKFTVKCTPKAIIRGRMATELADVIDVCQARKMQQYYAYSGNFRTALNQNGGR